MHPSYQNTNDTPSFPPNYRSTHLVEQLGSHRPVIFNTSTLYAILGTENHIDLKVITSTGVSGGTVHPDSPLEVPSKEFRIRASMGDIRQMGDCYAGVRVLALDDPVRDEGEFYVDRELTDGVLIYLQGNTIPTRCRMLIYAESNANDPNTHNKLAELYRNPEFHFQFNLALYYEALDAQHKLLKVGAGRVRQTASDTAATRARGKQSFSSFGTPKQKPETKTSSFPGTTVAGFLYGQEETNTHSSGTPAAVTPTTDPRTRLPLPHRSAATGVAAATPTPRPLLQDTVSPTPTSSSLSSTPSVLSPPAYAKIDAPAARGEKLSANQRRRRNKANRRASLSGSTDSSKTSPSSLTPSLTPPPPRTPKSVPRPAILAPSPSATLPTTTTSSGGTPQTGTSSKSFVPRTRTTPPSSIHPPQTPANFAASQKRQHSPPSPPYWNARGTETLFRKNLPARQGHDWRAAAEVGSTGTGSSSGLRAPYEYSSPEELRTQPTPPPFSFDHIIQSKSRAIVFCPPPQTSSASSSGTARSFQTTTTLRSTGTSSYVAPPSTAASSNSNVVFGTSGASVPAAQVSQATRESPQSQVIGTSPARSLPVAGAPSTPFYPTTFESIPNTVQANTLMDLEHGVDDCNDYPRLSDISEMEEGELVDTDGYTTVVNKRKSKRLAMLAKRARTSEDKVSATLSTPLPPRSTLLTNSPNSQREHSYIGKGKQRARYQGSTKSRSNSGELLNLPHDLELELSAPRPQKRRDFRKDEP
ncbi:hypothetical protein P7C70_g8141, partial [Phenoliferia sp. Uapishka_3]